MLQNMFLFLLNAAVQQQVANYLDNWDTSVGFSTAKSSFRFRQKKCLPLCPSYLSGHPGSCPTNTGIFPSVGTVTDHHDQLHRHLELTQKKYMEPYLQSFTALMAWCLTFESLRLYLCTISFNIQKFCVLRTLHLCVLRGSQKAERMFLDTTSTYLFL
jgi:hypothetical protein